MIYKTFEHLNLSALGFGAMRLPVIDGDDARIDEAATAKMVAYAMEQGINYFDTAWGYHGGQSEIVMGKILAKYPRQSFFLASKFPGYDLANMDKAGEIFEEQLKKCRVDSFDFYLFHNVCEMNINAYLEKKHGIHEYLLQQKEAGRIHHLGFSTHGGYEVMKRFLDSYGDKMEFCQIQLNYFDWIFQGAKAKVALLDEYHIPFWVMEPLRGGRLAALSEEHAAKLKALRPEESVPAWAFRFLQTIPGATVTLSGMSDIEQVRANIRTFEDEKPLNTGEWNTLLSIADEMTKEVALPCTACSYCLNHCPQRLDIPGLISLYNEHRSTEGGFGFIAPMALTAMPKEKRPNACIGCRSCEAVCPQKIKISETLADFVNMLN